MIDHFGKETMFIPDKDGWFTIITDISVSPVFFAWMFQFGNHAVIKAPTSLITEMKELAEQTIKRYSDLTK